MVVCDKKLETATCMDFMAKWVPNTSNKKRILFCEEFCGGAVPWYLDRSEV